MAKMVKINVLDLENLFLLVSSFWCRENFGPIIIIFHFCFCHALFAARRRIILVTQNVERIPKIVKSYPKCWKDTQKSEKLPKSMKSYPKSWVKSYANVLRHLLLHVGLFFLFVLFRYSNIWGIRGLIQPVTNSLTSQASILPIESYHTM